MKIKYRKFNIFDCANFFRLLNHTLVKKELPYLFPLSFFLFYKLCLSYMIDALRIKQNHVVISMNQKLIGLVSTHSECIKEKKAFISFELHPDFWGKGITSNAIIYFISLIQIQGKYNKILALADAENFKSHNVLKKCGFKLTSKNYIFKNFKGSNKKVFSYEKII